MLGYTANQNELKLQHCNGWQNRELGAEKSTSYVTMATIWLKAMAICMLAHIQLNFT